MLRNCFNYNKDRFCCTARNAQLIRNVVSRSRPAVMSQDFHKTYGCTNALSAGQCYSAPDTSGVVSPNGYTLTSQGHDYTWCSRVPKGLSQHGQLPCQSNIPSCSK